MRKKTRTTRNKKVESTNSINANSELIYFNKLHNIVRIVGNNHPEYLMLLKKLFSIEFYSQIERDYNRSEDAYDLRKSLGHKDTDFGAARLLEVLVVLAIRYADDMKGSAKYKGFRVGFWEIINNIGFGHLTDEYIVNLKDPHDGQIEIHKIADVFLGRKYNKDGSQGGAFILEKPPKNMAETELYYQLQYYIVEKKSKDV